MSSANRIRLRPGKTLNRKMVVWVYRNLHKKCYSLMQNGHVVAYADRFCLKDVTFRVREAGLKRCRKTGKKNVHAFMIGTIVSSGMGVSAESTDLPVKVHYNPRKFPFFYHTLCVKPEALNGLWFATLNKDGVFGAYCD